MKVGVYARVSTAKQAADDKTSIDEQVRICRSFARGNGDRVVDVYKDTGISGTLLERPELGRAILDARAGHFDRLIVLDLNRLARDVLVQETIVHDLKKADVEVVSVNQGGIDDSPAGELVRQVFGAIAQYDRAMTVWRMKLGRDAKRRLGGYAEGAPPFGFRALDGALVPDPIEQEVIAAIRRLKREKKTLRQICTELENRGFRPKKGGRWHPMAVKRVLELDNKPRARRGTKNARTA